MGGLFRGTRQRGAIAPAFCLIVRCAARPSFDPPRDDTMLLEGSCRCGAVRFSLRSPHPYPFNLCYCSICRKTAGGGGFAINLGGDAGTLEVEGRDSARLSRHDGRGGRGRAQKQPGRAPLLRPMRQCLWLFDPRWPELVHPLASAIDTALPIPPERTHLMLGSKAPWVEPAIGPRDQQFAEYPKRASPSGTRRLGLVAETWLGAPCVPAPLP